MDNFNTFFEDTNFDTARIQGDLDNAQLFGDKFAETFTPEASISLEEAKKGLND